MRFRRARVNWVGVTLSMVIFGGAFAALAGALTLDLADDAAWAWGVGVGVFAAIAAWLIWRAAKRGGSQWFAHVVGLADYADPDDLRQVVEMVEAEWGEIYEQTEPGRVAREHEGATVNVWREPPLVVEELPDEIEGPVDSEQPGGQRYALVGFDHRGVADDGQRVLGAAVLIEDASGAWQGTPWWLPLRRGGGDESEGSE